MDFLNKLGKKASETYKVTAEMTGKLAKEAKLKMKMNENKAEIEELYKEIGKKVYEKHLIDSPENLKEELEEECTKIDVLSAEIENTLKECLSLKDKKQCENCYEEIEKTAQYCSNCGAKQELEEEQEEDNYKGEDVIEAEVVEEKPETKKAEVILEETKKED